MATDAEQYAITTPDDQEVLTGTAVCSHCGRSPSDSHTIAFGRGEICPGMGVASPDEVNPVGLVVGSVVIDGVRRPGDPVMTAEEAEAQGLMRVDRPTA